MALWLCGAVGRRVEKVVKGVESEGFRVVS